MMKIDMRATLGMAALAMAACSPEAGATRNSADMEIAANGRAVDETVAANAADMPVGTPMAPDAAVALKLVAPADAAAVAAVRKAASAMSDVTITTAQSFRIMAGTRQVATFVAGEGKPAEGIYAGCFAAIVQNGRATIVPTIGSGNWEAETCGETSAVGILSANDPTLIGIVYQASSPNAEVTEPVILTWDRTAGTLALDEARSTRASTAGATSVAAMRRLVAKP